MTPPDSGDLCIICKLPATRGLEPGKLFWCGKHGPFYDKPDSGEREVPASYSHTVCIGWPTIQRLANQGGVYFAEQDVALVAADDLFRNSGTAILPLPLAQRILAALEDIDTQEVRAIRAELRARLPP